MVQLMLTDQSQTSTDQALTIRISYDAARQATRFQRGDETVILPDSEQGFGSPELHAMLDVWLARATRNPGEIKGPDDEEFWNLMKQEFNA